MCLAIGRPMPYRPGCNEMHSWRAVSLRQLSIVFWYSITICFGYARTYHSSVISLPLCAITNLMPIQWLSVTNSKRCLMQFGANSWFSLEFGARTRLYMLYIILNDHSFIWGIPTECNRVWCQVPTEEIAGYVTRTTEVGLQDHRRAYSDYDDKKEWNPFCRLC